MRSDHKILNALALYHVCLYRRHDQLVAQGLLPSGGGGADLILDCVGKVSGCMNENRHPFFAYLQ